MSDLGDEYTKATQELAELMERFKAARAADHVDEAVRLHGAVLEMFVKVETLHKKLKLEHSQTSGD